MKIKQIEQISDTEVNVTWENGDVQNLQGQSAVTLLKMTEMKVGEIYKVDYKLDKKFCGLAKVINIGADGVAFAFIKGILRYLNCFYNDISNYTFTKKEKDKKEKPVTTAKESVETELDELSVKCRKLEAFVISPKFTELCYTQQYLLENQLGAMLDYEKCLKARLDCWDK